MPYGCGGAARLENNGGAAYRLGEASLPLLPPKTPEQSEKGFVRATVASIAFIVLPTLLFRRNF